MENKNWNVGCIEKWYGISDKVAFWDGKIRWDMRSGCECSYFKIFFGHFHGQKKFSNICLSGHGELEKIINMYEF